MGVPAVISSIRRSFLNRALLVATFICLTACTALFQPNTETYPDADSITDVPTLIGYGDAYFGRLEYNKALTYYNRAISLSPTSSKARMNASRAVLVRDEVPALLALGTLTASGANPLGALAGTANSSTLFSSNGALHQMQTYLNNSATKSWFYGQCDTDVPTNSLTGLFNILYAGIIEMPVVLYDLKRDFNYNNTNHLTNNGDLVIYSGGTMVINDSTNYFFTEAASIASDMVAASNYSTNAILALDARLKTLHDLTELLLAGIKSIDLLGRLDILDQVVIRINGIPGSSIISSTLTTLTSMNTTIRSQFAGDATVSSFLGGHSFSSIHSNLNGSFAFVSNQGLSSFSPSAWVTVTSSSVQANANNLQGSLKSILNTNPPP